MASVRGIKDYVFAGLLGSILCAPFGVPSLALAQSEDPVFSSAAEHYEFLLERADGGTRHDSNSLPDWSGIWLGGAGMSSMRHPVDAPLTPDYEAGYDELQRQMEDDGQIDFDRLTDCVPTGYPRWIFGGANFREFALSPDQT